MDGSVQMCTRCGQDDCSTNKLLVCGRLGLVLSAAHRGELLLGEPRSGVPLVLEVVLLDLLDLLVLLLGRLGRLDGLGGGITSQGSSSLDLLPRSDPGSLELVEGRLLDLGEGEHAGGGGDEVGQVEEQLKVRLDHRRVGRKGEREGDGQRRGERVHRDGPVCRKVRDLKQAEKSRRMRSVRQ